MDLHPIQGGVGRLSVAWSWNDMSGLFHAHITWVSWRFTCKYEIGRQLMKAPQTSAIQLTLCWSIVSSMVDLISPIPKTLAAVGHWACEVLTYCAIAKELGGNKSEWSLSEITLLICRFFVRSWTIMNSCFRCRLLQVCVRVAKTLLFFAFFSFMKVWRCGAPGIPCISNWKAGGCSPWFLCLWRMVYWT